MEMTPALEGAEQNEGNHYPVHIASNIIRICNQTNGKERRARCADLVGSHQDSLLLKHLREVPILVHRHQDITSTNKFLVQVQLRDSRPVRELFDT